MRRLSVIIVAAALLGAVPGAAPALAAGERTIAVVVDFGAGGNLPASFTLCVKEPAGATDAQALADALVAHEQAEPTYSSAGLLCSIAGLPGSGCGTPTSSGYSYWAYFHGSPSSWTYASDGPAEHTASPTTSEGWRYESNGRGNPSDPPPAGPSRAATLCPSTVAPTPTTTVPASSPPTTLAAALEAPTTSTTTTPVEHGSTSIAPVVAHEASKRVAAGTQRSSGSSTSSGVMTGAALLLLVALVGAGLWLRRRGHA